MKLNILMDNNKSVIFHKKNINFCISWIGCVSTQMRWIENTLLMSAHFCCRQVNYRLAFDNSYASAFLWRQSKNEVKNSSLQRNDADEQRHKNCSEETRSEHSLRSAFVFVGKRTIPPNECEFVYWNWTERK